MEWLNETTTNLLSRLLEDLSQGQVTLPKALEQLRQITPAATAMTDEAAVDLDRRRRCGLPEVVYCKGKTSKTICEIFARLMEHGEPVLGTRISESQAKTVIEAYPDAKHNPIARTVRIGAGLSSSTPAQVETDAGKVAVITAGTSDHPVAEEAIETLKWIGCKTDLIIDVGVAGVHRLLEQRTRFETSDAVVVVAGMEGALPSVVGGLVDCPVIAVPTSVGYGAAFGGLTALLGMLNSCSSNVTVVNIDAGFKAGYVAGLIARRSRKIETPQPKNRNKECQNQ